MFKKIFNTVKKIAKKIIKEIKHFMEVNQEVEIAKIEATKEIAEKTGSAVCNAVKTVYSDAKSVYSDAKSSKYFIMFMAISALGAAVSLIIYYNDLNRNNEVIVNVQKDI